MVEIAEKNREQRGQLDQYLTFRNGKTSPERTATGEFVVYGSNGQIGQADGYNVNGPSIVIGRVGSYCGSLYYSDSPIWVTDNAIVCEAKETAETRFWYYALQTLRLNERSSGSGQPLLNQSVLRSIGYKAPNRELRIAIAEVLGALDDKIAANDKVALTLSEIAAAKYSSTSSNSDHVVPLKEIVTTQYGVTTKASEEPGPYLIRVTDINKKPWVEWETTPFCSVESKEWEKYKVSAGDILVARMADPGKAAYIDVEHPDAVFASYLVRLRPFEPSQALYIYYFLCSPEYRAYSAGAMQGSVQKNMNAKVIVDTQIALPSEESLTEFNAFVSPIRSQIQQMLSENATLKAVRDTLLPLLMSGKIRVQDAETALEEVL